jgi:hypothetical protein
MSLRLRCFHANRYSSFVAKDTLHEMHKKYKVSFPFSNLPLQLILQQISTLKISFSASTPTKESETERALHREDADLLFLKSQKGFSLSLYSFQTDLSNFL